MKFFLTFILLILVKCEVANAQDSKKYVLSIVGFNNKLGIADINGKILIPTIYEYIDFNTGKIICSKDNMSLVYDNNFKLKHTYNYGRISNITNTSNYLIRGYNWETGLLLENGTVKWLKSNGSWSFFNKHFGLFNEKDSMTTIYNMNLNIVSKTKYEITSNGCASSKNNNYPNLTIKYDFIKQKNGLYDIILGEILPAIYEDIFFLEDFNNEIVQVNYYDSTDRFTNKFSNFYNVKEKTFTFKTQAEIPKDVDYVKSEKKIFAKYNGTEAKYLDITGKTISSLKFERLEKPCKGLGFGIINSTPLIFDKKDSILWQAKLENTYI